MKATILAAMLACAFSAHAATVGVHLGSYHPGRPDLNPVNPGLYYRSDAGWTVGGYYNSIRRPSFYAGRTFDWKRFSVTVGGITGYQTSNPVELLLVPSVRLGGGFRLAYVPKFEKSAQTFHLTYEWSM